jgi:protein SCO1/2
MKYLYPFTILSAVFYVLLLSSCNHEDRLPIYGSRDTATVKDKFGKMHLDSVDQTIPDFKFLNQDSVYITNNTFKDKIYIADFFFTSCSSICPVMHRNLKTIFEKFKDNPEVSFLSHSIDYKYDTPSVLKKYAEKLGVYGSKWQFAYGTKQDIYTIAEKSYLVAVIEDSKEKEGYVHQGWLVLIDKNKRIRGAYDGTNAAAIAQLMKDIPVLLKEPKNE